MRAQTLPKSHSLSNLIKASLALETKEPTIPLRIEAPTKVDTKAKDQEATDFVDPIPLEAIDFVDPIPLAIHLQWIEMENIKKKIFLKLKIQHYFNRG